MDQEKAANGRETRLLLKAYIDSTQTTGHWTN